MFVLCGEEFMPAVGEIEATRAFVGQNPVIARPQWPFRNTKPPPGRRFPVPFRRASAAVMSSTFLMPMA